MQVTEWRLRQGALTSFQASRSMASRGTVSRSVPTWHFIANLCICRLLTRGRHAKSGARALLWTAGLEYDSGFCCLPDVVAVLIAFMIRF